MQMEEEAEEEQEQEQEQEQDQDQDLQQPISMWRWRNSSRCLGPDQRRQEEWQALRVAIGDREGAEEGEAMNGTGERWMYTYT